MAVSFETFDAGVRHIRAWQQARWITYAHYHECIELIHITEGEITIDVAGERSILKAGDTIFIPSYAVHEIPEVHDYRYFVLQISLALIPDCKKILNGIDPGVMILRGDETGDIERMFLTAQRMCRLRGLYTDLYESEEEHYNQYRLAAELVVSTVLMKCRQLGLLCEPTNPLPRVNSLVISAVDYIHAHFREKLRLADIAAVLYCSPQTLSANFRSAMHMSVPEYIASMRTARVYWMVTEQPDKPLSEIAEETGFQCLQSMLRAFRRHYNCAPSEMKKLQSTKL